MMRKSIVTVVVIFIFVQSANGSMILTPADTGFFNLKAKPKIFLNLDRTGSFVGGKEAVTNEFKIGLEFRKKLRLGIGYGVLVSDVVVQKNVIAEMTGQPIEVNAELSLRFFSINSEYIFKDSKKWQITMPSSIAVGSSYFGYWDTVPGKYVKQRTDEGGVLILGASALATYRILRWIGLSAGLGYRVAVVNNHKVTESFNSPVYVFKVRIFMGEIYKSVFPRGIFGKHNPPYSNEYWD